MKKCPFCAEQIQDEAVVCKHCGRDLSSQSKPSPPPARSTSKRPFLLAVAVAVALIVVLLMASDDASDTSMAPAPAAAVPRVDSIAIYDNSSEVVPYGGYIGKEFTAPAGWQCAVRGSVIATQGGNEDLIVYVLNDNEMINWRNNPATTSTFTSPQQKATTLDVPLNPGHYHLLVSNTFSALTNKMATANVHMVCQQR